MTATQHNPITYAGVKKLDTIKRAVKKNNWPWDDSKYDAGSDWITFGFIYKSRCFDVAFRPFGGKFMVKDGDKFITEENTEYDNVPWYRALMDFIYISKKAKKTTRAHGGGDV